MTAVVSGAAIEPFFLAGQHGERFCIYHPARGTARGGVMYLHPFAEEMNKARRMAALQSRAFAAAGYCVLQMDLLGCGDSSGDFGDATWAAWQQDVVMGVRWLRERVTSEVMVWGLRLGALLALDSARFCDPAPTQFVFWQPVLSGEMMLTQFLRLKVTGEMLSEGSATTGVRDLRAQWEAGRSIEVAGYTIAPQLALPIDGLKLTALKPMGAKVHWLEVVGETGGAMSPATQRIADNWKDVVLGGVACVPGQPFWNTVETTECTALVAATTKCAGVDAA